MINGVWTLQTLSVAAHQTICTIVLITFSVSHHQWRLGRAKWQSRASRNLVHPGCCWLPPSTFVPHPRERYQTVWTGHAPARGHFLAPLSASIEATVCLGLHKVSVRENGGFVCIELTRSDIDGGCEYDECRCSTEPLSPLCVCLNVAMKLRSLRFRLPRLCRIAVLKSNQRSERRSPSPDWENLRKPQQICPLARIAPADSSHPFVRLAILSNTAHLIIIWAA